MRCAVKTDETQKNVRATAHAVFTSPSCAQHLLMSVRETFFTKKSSSKDQRPECSTSGALKATSSLSVAFTGVSPSHWPTHKGPWALSNALFSSLPRLPCAMSQQFLCLERSWPDSQTVRSVAEWHSGLFRFWSASMEQE